MNRIKTACKIKAAVSVGDQGSRTNRIDFAGNDGNPDLCVCPVFQYYFVRDECFLFQDPQSPVKGCRPRFTLRKDQYVFTPVIRTLDYLKQLAILGCRSRVVENASSHKWIPI